MPTATQMRRGVGPPQFITTSPMLLTEAQIAATANLCIFTAEKPCKIIEITLLVETTHATHDDNYWTFQVDNVTQSGADLLSTAINTKVTGGVAITAETAYNLGPDQNLSLAVDDVLELTCTKVASATALAVGLRVSITYVMI